MNQIVIWMPHGVLFGGKPGAVGKMEIYNIKDPSDVRQEYSKFSGLRTEEGDVVSYISPSGGGFSKIRLNVS